MAPEQAAGRNDLVDARTDVYGLGSILYEMLAGQPPYVGEVMDVLKRVQEERPKAPSELAWGRDASSASSRRMLVVPPELEALCMRALSKDLSKRPQTALAFAEDLANVAGGKRALPKTLPTGQLQIHDLAESLGSKRGRWVPILLVVFLMLLAASATFVVFTKYRGASDITVSGDKAMKHLEEFRPELVGDTLGPDALKRPEFSEILRRRDQMVIFKQQLIDRIEATNPYIAKLSIGSKVEKNVTLMKARDDGITFVIGNQVADFAPWTRFGPTGIREMALHSEKLPPLLNQPGNKFALALYALSANYPAMARDLFKELRGTQYEPQAAEYLRELNEGQ
jgi:hypothetical protein